MNKENAQGLGMHVCSLNMMYILYLNGAGVHICVLAMYTGRMTMGKAVNSFPFPACFFFYSRIILFIISSLI